MPLFRRRGDDELDEDLVAESDDTETGDAQSDVVEAAAPPGRPSGPWDAADVADDGEQRLDLGALQVPSQLHHPADIPLVYSSDNNSSRADPARGRRKPPTRPANPRNANGEKPCSRTGIPAYPRSGRKRQDRPVTPEVDVVQRGVGRLRATATTSARTMRWPGQSQSCSRAWCTNSIFPCKDGDSAATAAATACGTDHAGKLRG